MGYIGTISLSFREHFKEFSSRLCQVTHPQCISLFTKCGVTAIYLTILVVCGYLLGSTTHASLIDGGAEPRMICDRK